MGGGGGESQWEGTGHDKTLCCNDSFSNLIDTILIG